MTMQGLIFAGILVASVTIAGTKETDAFETCDALRRETLAIMDAVPLMKDELATAVMWLRLDGEKAAAAGDADRCVERMSAARALLQGWQRGSTHRR